MPNQEFFRGEIGLSAWQICKIGPMERIVIAAVFKIVLKAAADFDMIVGRDGDVAFVEKAVDVAPE